MSGDATAEVETVSVKAFGHRFEGLLAGIAEDLVTLEKEGAIYSHFWDDDAGAFRYYRIPLLPAEIFAFVEATLAYQEFQKAVRNAQDAPPQDWLEVGLAAVSSPEIADRARRYGNYGRAQTRDGFEIDIRGCHASFYPEGMEELLCGHRPDRYELLPELGGPHQRLGLLLKILDNFPQAARILASRNHNRPSFRLENEYDVQDLLFATIRAVFDDARREEWTPKHAGSAKRIDIVVPSVEVVVETKMVRDKKHATTVADELRVDIESYHAHPKCKHLLALVYDPQAFISDPGAIMQDLSGLRVKGTHSFDVSVLIRS